MSATYLWDTARQGGAGYLRVGAGGTGTPPTVWVDTFVLGTTEPIGGINVGTGVYQARPAPVVDASGLTGVSYSSSTSSYTVAAGVMVEDRVFSGFVNLGDGSRLVNCLIAGPSTEVANGRGLVQGPSTLGQAFMDWCTIDPTTASPYYDGIGRGIYARRTWIRNVTDGVRAFSTSTNGVRIRLEGCLIDNLAQFSPDYAYPGLRAETHNDGCQAQGNANGSNTDLYFDGCKINARHSLTKGDLPPYRAQIAALMLTPNVGPIHMTFTRGWLLGGDYCVNIGYDDDISSAIITDTRFERPGTDMFGDGRAPTRALSVRTGFDLTHYGNTYIDNGAAVPVIPG